MERTLVILSLLLNLILLHKYFVELGRRLLRALKLITKSSLIFCGFLQRSNHQSIKNNPVVYRVFAEKINYLAGQATLASDLPQALIITPDHYQFMGQSYELKQEGLYRLVQPLKENQQRIVYQKEVDKLLSALAWLVTHGDRDDLLSPQKLKQKALHNKLILTCEATARFAGQILKEVNVPYRIVGTRTLDEWNAYDCGHYLIEVFRADLNQWVLYDLDHKVCFTYLDKYLSLFEFMDVLAQDYQIHSISNAIRCAVTHSQVEKFDLTFIDEGRIADLKRWYHRIVQLVFIEDSAGNFSCNDFDLKRLSQYPKGAFPPIKYLSKAAFADKFYLQTERSLYSVV